MRPADERRSYIVTSSLIGWAHPHDDRWSDRNKTKQQPSTFHGTCCSLHTLTDTSPIPDNKVVFALRAQIEIFLRAVQAVFVLQSTICWNYNIITYDRIYIIITWTYPLWLFHLGSKLLQALRKWLDVPALVYVGRHLLDKYSMEIILEFDFYC